MVKFVEDMMSFIKAGKIILVILLIAVALPVIRSHAQNPIQVSEQTTESKFQESFVFRVQASSTAGTIISARLFMKERFAAGSTLKIADKFKPAAAVDLTVTVDYRNELIPPWQFYTYRWEITDSAGNILITPEEETQYTDDTHPWQNLSDGKVRVYWYNLSDDFGKRTFESAQKGFEHVEKITNFTPDGELAVIIYPSQKEFLKLYPAESRKYSEWLGGQSFGTITVQWYRADTEAFLLQEVIPHELAHNFLYYRLAGKVTKVPPWLNEGQAMNSEFTGVDAELATTRYLASIDKLRRLHQMGSPFNISTEGEEISYWYSQATSLVAYLYQEYQPEVLGKLLDEVNDGARFEDAFKEVTGLTLLEFEIKWREWVGAQPLSEDSLKPTQAPTWVFPPTRDYRKPTRTKAPKN